MAEVVKLKDGTVATIHNDEDFRNFSELVKEYLGDDCQRYFDTEIIDYYLIGCKTKMKKIDILYEKIDDLHELVADLK